MICWQRLRLFTFALAVSFSAALCGYPAPTCFAAPAHFWITSDPVSTAGPSSIASINITAGHVGELHIWGRPETGKKLRNISLNLIADQAGINFIDNSIVMHNNAGNGQQRFEYISDSTSTPVLKSEETLLDVTMNGQVDSIELLQGYTISTSSATVQGFGGQCIGGELGCVIASDGLPAWLIGSVEYNAIAGGPMTQIYLQVGSHGINHESLLPGDYDRNGIVDTDDLAVVAAQFSSTTNLWPDGNGNGRVDAADHTIWRDNLGSISVFESSTLTSVRFGADKSDGVAEPIYNGSTDRDTQLAQEDPEATITISAPFWAAQTSVPEPTTLGLLLVSLLGIACRRKNRFLSR